MRALFLEGALVGLSSRKRELSSHIHLIEGSPDSTMVPVIFTRSIRLTFTSNSESYRDPLFGRKHFSATYGHSEEWKPSLVTGIGPPASEEERHLQKRHIEDLPRPEKPRAELRHFSADDRTFMSGL